MADSRHYLSTAQVAQALGVGVSTVKRWVDEGIIPAYRTPGGHRKLLLADVLRLAKEGTFPHVNLARLGAAATPPPEPTTLVDRLAAALDSGAEDEAGTLLRAAYQGGLPLPQLADAVIAPAMRRIGEGWECGRLDVMHEHQATQILLGILYDLRAELRAQVTADRPVALVGGPEDDPYLAACLLIDMILLELGWDVVNLGPNTPMSSFRRALANVRPRLVCLSVSYLEDEEAFRREYTDFYQAAEQQQVPIAIGGNALTPALRAVLPYTTFGDGLAHLSAFARTLAPPPRRPPRGRPRGKRKD